MNRAILRVKLAKSNTVSNGQTDERRRMKEENLGHAIFLHPVSTIMELLTTCSDSTGVGGIAMARASCGHPVLNRENMCKTPCIELRKICWPAATQSKTQWAKNGQIVQ